MSSAYAKGTQVWLADSTTSWQPATVTSITIPDEPTGEVVLVVALDKSDESKTLKFSLEALKVAAEGVNGVQPPAPVSGQDAIPPLRNPPVLESAEDLSALSNLNEPSGGFLCELALMGSFTRYRYTIRHAPAIHLFRDRSRRSQPFQPTRDLWTGNDSVVCWEKEG